jgi:flagellar hook-length control protein FliK
VRLTLTQDSAAAEFVSPHAEVRAAIESAIARLREAMAEAGIQLGEASVSAESFSDRAGGEAQPRNARNGYRDAPLADHALSPSSRRAVTVTRGLVDVFA